MIYTKLTLIFSFILLSFTTKENIFLPIEFTAKVIAIKDGDSIDVFYENKKINIRLADVDCPEIKNKQPFGRNAKAFTSKLCYGQKVTVQSNNKYDRYKRLIATIINEQNKNVNRELVIAGLAWHFKKYSTNNEFAILENNARSNKMGLWKDNNPTAPWEWRKPK
jgi:micrococcal nuclease